ncbi:MAG: acylphosphatase [Candidatus Helarchaeota archaeon]
MKRLHVIVYGKVQGVFFRHNTKRFAMSLKDVTGWVRNNWDGTVEVVAEGPEKSLRKLLDFLRRGPRYARVTHVENRWEEYKGEFDKFSAH